MLTPHTPTSTAPVISFHHQQQQMSPAPPSPGPSGSAPGPGGAPHPDMEHDLPAELLQQGWRKFWSKRENRIYYWNKANGESLWEMPPLRSNVISNLSSIYKKMYHHIFLCKISNMIQSLIHWGSSSRADSQAAPLSAELRMTELGALLPNVLSSRKQILISICNGKLH